MFVRLAQAVGWIGWLAMVVVAGLGLRLEGTGDAAMPTHFLVGTGSMLPVVFADSWLAIYLLASARGARRLVLRGQLDPRPALAARDAVRRVVPGALAGIALAAGAVASGAWVFTGELPGWTHGLLALATVGWHLVLGLRVRRELAAHTAAFAELDAAYSAWERRDKAMAPTAVASAPP